MQTILIICDDEKRRAELHRQLLPDFEVYAASHDTAASLQKQIKNKDVIIVKEEGMGTEKKISIHPVQNARTARIAKLLKSILGEN